MEKEIFFCENNVSKGLEEIIEKLEEKYKDLDVYIEPCQGQCSICSEKYFVVIDSEVIEAETPEELYETIMDIQNNK